MTDWKRNKCKNAQKRKIYRGMNKMGREENRTIWMKNKHTHTQTIITKIIIIVIWLQLSYSILDILVRIHLNFVGSIAISRRYYIMIIIHKTKHLLFIMYEFIFSSLLFFYCGKSSTQNDRNLLNKSEIVIVRQNEREKGRKKLNGSQLIESCYLCCSLPSFVEFKSSF